MRTQLFAVALLSASVGLAGCGSTPLREPDQYDSATMSGCGTDENWRAFDDRELSGMVTTDDSQATYFNPPLIAGASFPSAPRPTFAWQPTSSIAGKAPRGDATCTECPTCKAPARPHLPAVSGDAYDLQFSVGGKDVWRIIYTSQEWSPPDALWSSWKGQTVTVKAYRMVLKVNDVQSGPFTSSTALTFSVGS